MIRWLVYILILSALIFTPFSFVTPVEKKSYTKPSQSISVKLVEPQPLEKKKKEVKVVKPKTKPKPKKRVKKKKLPKKKPLPKPKSKPLPKPVEKPEPMIEKVEEVTSKQLKPTEPVDEPVTEQKRQTSNASEINAYYASIYRKINEVKHYPKKSRRFKQEDVIL